MNAASDPSLPPELLARLYARTRGGSPRDPLRTRRLLDRLGIPDPPNVVHVVGTNGKGSVAWRIDAGLRAGGVSCLRFLSPHVERFDERIAVDGVPVTRDEAATFLERAWREEPTPQAAFFELCTAMALYVAHARGADWAVLEAGVGAAGDATTAVRNVRAAVVTNVALDHAEAIGPDLVSIARDKAAAIRAGVPAVTAARGQPLDVLRRAAAERGAPLQVVDAAGAGDAHEPGHRAAGPGTEPPTVALSRALAQATLCALPLPPDRLDAALAAASVPPALPARRERLLTRGRNVLLDGAHNPAAARALAAELPPGHHLLLGVLPRKDPWAVAAALTPTAARVTLTAVHDGERPWGEDPRFEPDAERALDDALGALPEDGLLVVAGSLHLAGRLRPRLREG